MGADVIVTVRMPASLLVALERQRGQDHYSDLSEQLRSITRKGGLRYLALARGDGRPDPSDEKERRESQRDEKAMRLIEDLRVLLGGERP